MKKRFVAFVLCIATLLSSVALSNIMSVSKGTDISGFTDYGAVVGNMASLNGYIPLPITNDPTKVKNFWGTDCKFLLDEDISFDIEFIITDYMYIESNGFLWYKVEVAPGYTAPQKLIDYPWIFQDNMKSPIGNSLYIHSNGKNFVTDSEGNAVSSLKMTTQDEIELTCTTTLQGSIDYQWQIFVNNDWVNILDQTESTIKVTAGILASALDDNNTARVRCVASAGSKSVESSPIVITMTTYVPDDGGDEPEIVEPEVPPVPDDGDIYRYITVRYLFQNGAEAENPFIAKVLKTESLDVTVEFPAVQGYLPYYGNDQVTSLSINVPAGTNDITYTVYYLPTYVEYHVDVYVQNVHDDNYTFYKTETLQGLTGSKIPHVTVDLEGMYELLHETPTVAANGSTRIETFFNRIYYLTYFNLDGGYGVYPIYARYGSNLAANIGTPIKPGYTFVGWDYIDPETGKGDGIADVIPETIPAREQAYKAIWTPNPTAEVRIVFWGENPNDEKYSYIESQVLEVAPGTELEYGMSGNICGLEEHTHNNSCNKVCGLNEHSHDESCYTLICNGGHTHNTLCYTKTILNTASSQYGYVATAYKRLLGYVTEPINGNIYRCKRSSGSSTYYNFLYVNNTWYYLNTNSNYNGVTTTTGSYPSSPPNNGFTTGAAKNICGQEEHIHTDYKGSCYIFSCNETEHTHNVACYNGCLAHTHSNSCKINSFSSYSADKWTLVESDKVTVKADGTTVMNVYFDRTTFTMTFKASGSNGQTLATINDKWGADIRERFKTISEANTFLWSEASSGNSPWTSFMDVMPAKNMTYYANTTTATQTHTATYYGQRLNSTEYDVLYPVTIKYKGNITVSKEEFVEIEGFVFNESKSTKTGAAYNGAKFYYDRKTFRLEFYSGSELVRTEHPYYEESFSEYTGFTPKLPDEFEPGSRRFVGWYLNPECTGEMVDLATMKMPADNVALYAKWELVEHQVNIYKERFDDGTFGDPVLPDGSQPDPVLHGSKVFTTGYVLPIPENPPYKFIGWFYMDGGKEQMWDFEHSVVVKDTNIYAKWSADVLVPYTIRYIVQNKDGTTTQIADTLSSSALAGNTVTFSAKGGADLYEGYQTGFFPLTTSNSITMDVEKAEEGMFYDFVYVEKKKVPYTVRYVDEYGNDLIEPKVVADNQYAIVTEKFVYVEEYTPDKYQKTLVLNGTDGAVNEIVFTYKKNLTQSVYNVTHYIQNTGGNGYTEHMSGGDIADIGSSIKVAPLELKGFTYHHATVNGANVGLVGGEVVATLIKEGLDIKLYYERDKYPYKIQYVDKDTLKPLKDPEIITPGGYYGSTVTVDDPPEIENYVFSSVNSCIIDEDDPANPVKNVIYVFYTEPTVRINYEVLGPEDCGTVNPTYTDVKVITGTGASSAATASAGYKFVGWYADPECTQQVTAGATLYLTIPEDKVWKETTYYAKFERSVSDLTIVHTNSVDASQVFVYEVKNNETGETIYVTITGNGFVSIKNMPMGEYTVTQQNDWSWRYRDAAQVITHKNPSGTFVTFGGGIGFEQWLNGNSVLEKNKWGN